MPTHLQTWELQSGDILQGPAIPSLTGSELVARVLKAVHAGFISIPN